MVHHWVEGNCTDRCQKCKKSVKMFEGKHCRWCQTTVIYQIIKYFNDNDFL